jgi:hypothetical protein
LTPQGGLLQSTAQAIDTAYGALLTSLSPGNSMVILHGGFTGRVNGVPQYEQLTSDNVTSSQVYEVLATQRRRTNGVNRAHTTFRLV